MLTIRPEQMSALQEGLLNEFEFRAASLIRANRPDLCDGLSSEELEEEVRRGGGIARSYGLRTEHDQLHFLMLMLEYGRGFDTRLDWVAEVLLDADLDPRSKTEELYYRAQKRGSPTVSLDGRRTK